MGYPGEHEPVAGHAGFRVARNPDPDSRLPYPIWLPIEGGLVLKARETWPRANRVFCAQDATGWDESVGLLEDVAVLLCRRRGAAIDLVLDRPSLSRSQFVFTTARGRPAIWWQTQKTAQAANPGARIPRGRAAGPLTIAVATREKYGWKFADRALVIERRALGRRRRRDRGRGRGGGNRAQDARELGYLTLRWQPELPVAAPGRAT